MGLVSYTDILKTRPPQIEDKVWLTVKLPGIVKTPSMRIIVVFPSLLIVQCVCLEPRDWWGPRADIHDLWAGRLLLLVHISHDIVFFKCTQSLKSLIYHSQNPHRHDLNQYSSDSVSILGDTLVSGTGNCRSLEVRGQPMATLPNYGWLKSCACGSNSGALSYPVAGVQSPVMEIFNV